jgi:dihydrofolate reductase
VEVIHQPAELSELPGISGQVFIIGGSEIYAAFLPMLNDLLVSHVFENHDGDTFLPEFEVEFPQSEILETHSAFEVRRHFKSRPD